MGGWKLEGGLFGPQGDPLEDRREFASDFWVLCDPSIDKSSSPILVSRMVSRDHLTWELVLEEKVKNKQSQPGDRVEITAVNDFIIIQTYRPYFGLTYSRGLGNLLKVHASSADLVSVAANKNFGLVEPGDPTVVSDLLSEGRNVMMALDFFDGEPKLSFVEGVRGIGVTDRFNVNPDSEEADVGRVKGKQDWNSDILARFFGRVGYQIRPTEIEFYYLKGDAKKGLKERKTPVATIQRIVNGITEFDRIVPYRRSTYQELFDLLDKVIDLH